jgi:thioredoxin-like negative regulator of GroEL
MRVIWLAALAVTLAGRPGRSQETGLESVLSLMEKRVEGVRDVALKVVTQADRQMGMLERGEAHVVYVKGVGLRVRASIELEREARGMALFPRSIETIYAGDSVFFIQETDTAPGSTPLAFQTYRIQRSDPALKSTDAFFLPAGLPVRLMLEDPLLYYVLAPRLLFGLEPRLVYEGVRSEGGQAFHVLSSSSEPAALPAPRAGFQIDSRRKQFFVEAATGELRKIRWEVFSRRGMARRADERAIFTIEAAGSLKVDPALVLPQSSRWTIVDDGSGRGPGRNQTMLRSFESIRVNRGLGPESIATDAEKNDLYADAVLRPAEEYEARAARDPKDASAFYSLAYARGIQDPFTMMGRPGGPKPDVSGVVRALKKALEARPDSESAASNLLSAAQASGDAELEKTLLDRIAKGEIPGTRVRLMAAARLNATGDAEGAGRLLEGLVPARESDRARVALERLFVAAAKGDEDGLVRLFAQEAKCRPEGNDKFALVDALDARFESLPEAAKTRFTPPKLLELLDRAERADPAELAFPIARAAVLRRDGKPAAALIELLEAAPKNEAVVARVLRYSEDVKEWGAGEGEKLAASLEQVDAAHPGLGLLRARALGAAGKSDAAQQALVQALEACRKEPPGRAFHAEALRTTFQLAQEKGPGEWRENCVGVILAIGKGSGAIPFDMVFDEGKNPVTQLALDYESRREWMKFYRLATEANRLFMNSFWMMRRAGAVPAEGIDAIRQEVFKESDPAKYVEFVEFLEGVQSEAQVVDVLERAWMKAGQDREVLLKIARSYARHGARENAARAFEELIPRLGPEEANEARLELGEVHLKRGQPEKAREALGSIPLESLKEESLPRLIDLCAQAKDYDRGLEACKRAYALGLKPHFQTGTFYEKKQDYYEALRYYNRDRVEPSSGGPEAEARKMERDMRRRAQRAERGKSGKEEEEEPENGEEARARLLKKLGPDYLVTRLLDQKPEPLDPAQERKAKAALEKLSSEAIDDRDTGFSELKAIGPRAAPLLKPLLQSADEEVKNRIKQLLSEWAEPR